MIKNKFSLLFTFILMLIISVLLLLIYNNNLKSTKYSYETKLFSNSIVNVININLEEDVKNDLLSFPIDKSTYFNCNVFINGEEINNVGIRIKGGATLKYLTENKNSKKFGLKIKFDEYVAGQNYYGLDGLELNNQFYDKTFMCDYFVYDMMRFMGVAAPLVSFADVYVNNEYLGFYVCLENVKDSFLNRNFGNNFGNLYKPDDNLSYRGEDKTLYNNIWDSAKTNINEKDKGILIASLKDLNKSMNLEKNIKYFAVNNFVGSVDNYTGGFPHNYYLYEKDGILEILPWDYDYAFFNVGNRDNAYYFSEKMFAPLDVPVSREDGFQMENRPLWDFVIENEKTKKIYYKYIEEIINDYFKSGYFEREYNKIYSLIKSHIIMDYKNNISIYENESLDDIWARIESLKTLCIFRVNNVEKQLSGEISISSKDNYDSFNLFGNDTCKNCEYIVEESNKKDEDIKKKNSNKYFSFY